MFKDLPKGCLKIVYFIIANQVALRRGLVVLLILVNVVIWSAGFVKWTNYLSTLKAHNYVISLITKNLINYEDYKVRHQPSDLQVVLSTAIAVADNKYDFLAKVRNPNQNWAVGQIKYRFIYTGGVTDERQDFIMPNQEKYLLAFLQDVKIPVQEVSLDILEINWHRVKNKDLLYILPDLTADEARFTHLDNTSLVNFKVKNLTPYSFWSVGYQVVLYQGEKVIAASYVPVTRFLSLSELDLQVSWFRYLPNPSQIEIISDIDFLADVFILEDFTPGVPLGPAWGNGK